MAEIEYNDFGFAALDADELKSVDSKISSGVADANAVWYNSCTVKNWGMG